MSPVLPDRPPADRLSVGWSGVDSVAAALAASRRGEPVVLIDDRPGAPAHLLAPAESISTATMAAFVRRSSGLVQVAISVWRADRLDLPPMRARWRDGSAPSFTVAVDAAQGVTTGISAADRARTVRLLGSADCSPSDLHRPGHVLPVSVDPARGAEANSAAAAALQLVYAAGAGLGAAMAAVVSEDEPAALAGPAEARALASVWGLPVVGVTPLLRVLRG
jgi:3,4-dihydroxy 2-butanone 4-phosphate synthase / GTP cyclohydrolase II